MELLRRRAAQISTRTGERAAVDPSFDNLVAVPEALVLQFLDTCREPQVIELGPDDTWVAQVNTWASERKTRVRCLSRELLYLGESAKEEIRAAATGAEADELLGRVERVTYWGLEAISSNLAAELDRAAHLDKLTLLKNRAAFDADVEIQRKRGVPLSYALVDMDGLKAINDGQGHEAGDGAIQCLASHLSTLSSPDVVVSRWAGDEFAILASEMNAVELAALLNGARHSSEIKFSFGAACHPTDDVDWSRVTKLADERMYKQKRARKREQRLAAFLPERFVKWLLRTDSF